MARRYGVIYTYKDRKKVVRGKQYVFSDMYGEIDKHPEYIQPCPLDGVSEGYYPFMAGNSRWQFAREVIEE